MLATLAVSSSWAFYGLLRGDIFIIIPNMLGTALSTVQLVVLFKFTPTPNQTVMGPPRGTGGKDKTSYEYIGS